MIMQKMVSLSLKICIKVNCAQTENNKRVIAGANQPAIT